MSKVKLGGNQFGETYHVAGAMLMTPLLKVDDDFHNDSISVEQELGKPDITDAQKTFFNSIKLSNLTGTKGSVVDASKADCTEKFIVPAFAHNAKEALLRMEAGFLYPFSDNYNGDLEAKQADLVNFLKTIAHGMSPDNSKAVIWIRNAPSGKNRNMTTDLIRQIIATLSTAAAPINEFIFVGDAGVDLPDRGAGQTFYDLIGFFKEPAFTAISGGGSGVDADFTFATQLLTFAVLVKDFKLKVIVGMKSGAMDGPAMVGIPTIFFDEDTNGAPTRMSKLAAVIPKMTRVTFPSDAYDSNGGIKYKSMPAATITKLGAAVKKLG